MDWTDMDKFHDAKQYVSDKAKDVWRFPDFPLVSRRLGSSMVKMQA